MRKGKFISYSLPIILILAACTPKTSNAEPTIDVVGTTAAQLASVMLTQTAGAFPPTLPPPTDTPIPQFTETPTLEPTSAATSIPKVAGNTACYTGPSTGAALVSNISDTEEVEVVGVSNVPGWYVIRNPIYGSLCWISATNMRFEPDFDLTALPTIP